MRDYRIYNRARKDKPLIVSTWTEAVNTALSWIKYGSQDVRIETVDHIVSNVVTMKDLVECV